MPALYPIEKRAMQRSVVKRRAEFAKGRACARTALEHVGISPVAIPVGSDRAPIWPAHVVGSITHCDTLTAAVVARRGRVNGIGLDAEVTEPLPIELRTTVCTALERQWIHNATPPLGADWYKILFSAKESVHKAIFPICAEILDFMDVELMIDVARRRFKARCVRPVPGGVPDLESIRGRFELTTDVVVTGVVLL